MDFFQIVDESFLFHKSPGVHSSAKKIPSKYFPQIDTEHSTIFDGNCGKWDFFEIAVFSGVRIHLIM